MNKTNMVIIAGTSVAVAALIGASYCFSKAQYYQGRIDKYEEINPILVAAQTLNHELINKLKKYEGGAE